MNSAPMQIIRNHAGAATSLTRGDPEFGEIVLKEGQELVIIGVVTASIRRLVTLRSTAECHTTREPEGQSDEVGPRAADPFGASTK